MTPGSTPSCIEVAQGAGYNFEHFHVPQHYQEYLERVIIPHGLIQDRVEKLAADIAQVVKDDLVAVCILKGGYLFFSDLVKQIKRQTKKTGGSIPLKLEFMRVRSYRNDSSTGKVELNFDESELQSFRDRDILLVEDLIDTGRTMQEVLKLLRQYAPRNIYVVTLLWKRTGRNVSNYQPDFVGFTIPDHFIVGYALDYNEHFRDLDHICVISEKGKQAFAIPP